MSFVYAYFSTPDSARHSLQIASIIEIIKVISIILSQYN